MADPRQIETVEVEPVVFVPVDSGNLGQAAPRIKSFLSDVKDGIETVRNFRDGLAGELDDLFPRRNRTKPKAPTAIPRAERVP